MILALLKSPLVDAILISLAVYYIFRRKGFFNTRKPREQQTVYIRDGQPGASRVQQGEYIDYEEVK